MLKYESTAEVGDLIKAYDFEPMPDRAECYVVGIVIEKGTVAGPYGMVKAYAISPVATCWDGVITPELGEENIINVPFETSLDWDGRVTKV